MSLQARLVYRFLDHHAEDAAQVLESLPAADAASFLSSAPARAAACALSATTPQTAAAIMEVAALDAASAMLALMDVDAQVAVLHRLTPAHRKRVLSVLPAGQSRTLSRLLAYPPGSAGTLMDPNVFVVPSDISVREAVRRVRLAAATARYYVYVVDRHQKLVGVLALRQLLGAKGRESVDSIMTAPVISVPATMSNRDVLNYPSWKDFHGLPVVDADGVLVGVIRYETLGVLRRDAAAEGHGGHTLDTLMSLGELYWLGLTGMLPSRGSGTRRAPGADGGGMAGER